MMGMLWVILFVALTGTQSAYGLPVRPTPQTSTHDPNAPLLGWGAESGLYAVLPALVLVITGVGLLFGCMWCYRHKDCKPNEGAENQLFTASASHLHESRRTQPPDSGFSEPVNNNISEDNNNGPISLREMQNIANNNAAAYIVSENEERNRVSRESVVEFEPLPLGIRVVDPLENCADWFGGEDFPRNQLQYLREIGRGWFGRVVEGELEDAGNTSTVAVKILNQNASLEDKARFLNESKLYRDLRHENILVYVAKCLQEDPWMLIFEFCPTDLQQYLTVNRPKMAILNESGVPLRLMCDVTSALAYLHSRGYLYGTLWSGGVLVRGYAESARAVLGRYSVTEPHHEISPPETLRHPPVYTTSSEVWSVGSLIWEVCAWGSAPPHHPPPMPHLPCPYRGHLYQVMQLCWNQNPEARPSAAQVHALINHLHSTHTEPTETKNDTISGTSDFEERWQRLKPNTIPKIDEHVAIVHAPSTSSQHFSSSDQEFDHSQTIQDSLSVDFDPAVSRSSSIMSDKEPLSVQVKSESLTNLHGSLEDVRNIYLTHNEMAVLECHQGNISLEDSKEKERDKSDSSVDPWLKDIIAGSQDDVSYYKDVSDVIKNLDNILNSEKTSSSESSHQASPSRDNLSLDCKKDYPMQSSMVKSPGITNFQNILETGFNTSDNNEACDEDEGDRDTVGTLSHSFERHSDSTSQLTLANLTPETPNKDTDIYKMETEHRLVNRVDEPQDTELPKVSIVHSNKEIPKLKELCVASMPSVSEKLNVSEDCLTSCDKFERTDKETKSIEVIENTDLPQMNASVDDIIEKNDLEQVKNLVLPKEEFMIEKSTESLYAIPNVALIAQSEENLPNKFNDLIEPLIVKKFAYETGDNKPIDNVLLLNSEKDAVPETIANKSVDYSVINATISEMDCPTEVTDKPPDKDVSFDGKINIRNILVHKERDTLDNKSNVKLYTNTTPIINVKLLDDSLENINNLPIDNDVGGQLNADILSHTPEIKDDVVNNLNDVFPNEELEINNKLRKSSGIIESLAFIEFERNNFTDTPLLIKSNNIQVDESLEMAKSEKIELDKRELKDTDVFFAEDIPAASGNLPSETAFEDMTSDINTPHTVSEDNLSENIDLNKNSFTTEIAPSKVIFDRHKTAESSETKMCQTFYASERDVEKDFEISLDVSTESPRLPSPSHYSEDETILIVDPENSRKSGVVVEDDSALILNTEDKNISETDTSLNSKQMEPENYNSPKACEYDLPLDTLVNFSFDTDNRLKEKPSDIPNNASKHSSLSIDTENNLLPQHTPEPVQNNDKIDIIGATITVEEKALTKSPDTVQSNTINTANIGAVGKSKTDKDSVIDGDRSDTMLVKFDEQSNDSTIYKDLMKNTDAEVIKNSYLGNKQIQQAESQLEGSQLEVSIFSSPFAKLESTEYMDLPSINETTVTHLNVGQSDGSKNTEDLIVSSTPIVSDASAEDVTDKTIDCTTTAADTLVMGECKPPNYGAGVTIKKLEQRYVPESMSPFESPTRSHHTDTYDENSSVVLGPFENCTIELFKGVKSHELTDIPKEELLAFSSNFSEINLETPSPLRDGNFLNEVPDILHDDVHFDDIASISEAKPVSAQKVDSAAPTATQSSEISDDSHSETQKHVSPSTPPNSPGIFLASSSQQKYLVDIDLNLNDHVPEPSSSLQQEIELNQIELQITSKLAMAENENNLNIEYSGPLTVEAFVEEGGCDEVPERYLAGNGGSVEDLREGPCQLDEECVKALRNELELKLPLAQVAAIEPQCGGEWGGELPPPPELVVSYPGALSPIAEETGQQLSAYDNDTPWNPSTRTDSSESYPEPCNNSTDEATELPTGVQTHTHSTYTIHSKDHTPNTYTIQKDLGSSKELSMTVDSLNASPYQKISNDSESAVNDRTYNKDEHDKESNCERLSQVSPFLVSPTTDTSAPDTLDNFDNATGVSTLSKTTVPTDAKLSKPTECLSKATSIDSWCSNDTLYNVEENFDDMAVDPDTPLEFEHVNPEKEEGNSESTDTLTHNEHEKEMSHGSTYIIHDSKSEHCETFSRDSITANDNNTFTKAKIEAAGTTPSIVKSESRNSPTKDLAYGTLMSGVPSYSNCSTEAASALDDLWKLPQPELVRRSSLGKEPSLTPPKLAEQKDLKLQEDSPLTAEPRLNKMDSIDITFPQNNSDQHNKSNSFESKESSKSMSSSPLGNFMNDMPTLTSTPLTEPGEFENIQPIPMQLPQTECSDIPNFQLFTQSAELRPQELSSKSNQGLKSESEILLKGDSISTVSGITDRDSLVLERTPAYTDFEVSAVTKPQEMSLGNFSDQSTGSRSNSEGFRNFLSSARNMPQDLSSLIDASYMMLRNERMSSELAFTNLATSSNTHGGISTQTDTSKSTSEEPTPNVYVAPENVVTVDIPLSIDDRGPIMVNEEVSVEKVLDSGASVSNLDLDNQSCRNVNDNELTSEEPIMCLPTNPPSTTNLIESHNLVNFRDSNNPYLINFDEEEEMDQPHSIIITETLLENFRDTPNETFESHPATTHLDLNDTYDSHASRRSPQVNGEIKVDGDNAKPPSSDTEDNTNNSTPKDTPCDMNEPHEIQNVSIEHKEMLNGSLKEGSSADVMQRNGSQKYAVVNFLNETFEELIESNVDDSDVKDLKLEEEILEDKQQEFEELMETPIENPPKSIKEEIDEIGEGVRNESADGDKMSTVTEDFLQHEKNFCTFDSYFPMLSDIRFTGPATEIMSTSFSQDSPTGPASPECEQDSKPTAASDILKEWDSDSDTQSTNSSSGEFIWKDGDGRETCVVPSRRFEHQRGSGGSTSNSGGGAELNSAGSDGGGGSEASGSMGSASGSEGDEVEFVPSSWDCRAAPAKSSLRSLEQATPDSKKRVVFKRQKYHCVYEYPREVADVEAHSPAYLPDRSTYSEWDPSSAEEAELGYGQLFGAPSPLDLYPLRAGIALGADYDEDFFISSSARPFESLGLMSTASQFFPGMHMKQALLERDLSDEIAEDFPPPPSPLTATHTPSMDFTTPDSGVEDITPGSTIDEDFKKKLPEAELTWRPVDSASSSESVSPSSPGGEALGGLRHTRDKLKLDLPPSPHIPSPRHNRVFNFVLDKPKRKIQTEGSTTPLVMTDDTPVVTSSLPLQKDCEDLPIPEPTFSTFGKSVQKVEPEQKIILTDDIEDGEVKEESPKVVEPVKGEGTVLDSGDEDSGIESSSKATLERNKTSNVS